MRMGLGWLVGCAIEATRFKPFTSTRDSQIRDYLKYCVGTAPNILRSGIAALPPRSLVLWAICSENEGIKVPMLVWDVRRLRQKLIRVSPAR